MANRKIYNKLIRDNIPEFIENDEDVLDFDIKHIDVENDPHTMEFYLHRKLEEEIEEFKEDPCMAEWGDIFAVLMKVADFYGFAAGELRETFNEKADRCGMFTKNIVLNHIDYE